MTEDSGSGRPAFDPERIIEAFNRHAVRYVVIGAVAALAHGAPVGVTFDVDFTPARDSANLERLSDALRELNARIRTADVAGGLPFAHDAESLARMQMLNLTCDKGDFDLAFAPSGTGGYDDLVRRATSILIGTVEVSVAALDDVIRSKEAAGRPKDIAVLPILERHARAMRAGDNAAGTLPPDEPKRSAAAEPE
jgi:hypothetical protein